MFFENVRPAPGTNYAAPVWAPRHEDFAPFRAKHSIDGMTEVELPNRRETVWIRTTGALHDPHLEPIPRAEWRLLHAEEWCRLKVAAFETCKGRALASPLDYDWLPDLTRLRDDVIHAQKNLAARRADLDEARDPGGRMAAANEAIAEQIQRSTERREQERLKALSEIEAISINGTAAANDDE
jgi:hypothetical protein